MRKLAIVFGAALLLVGGALPFPAAAAGEKIGYVDLTRALNEIDEGKQVKKKLKREFDKKQKELDGKQNEVKAAKEEFDNLPPMVSEDVRRQKAQELQRQLYDLQILYANLQTKLTEKEAELTKPIFEKMELILNKIGKEQGYTLILEKSKSSILYAPPHMDLTNEMIRRFNKLRTPKKKGK